MRTETMSIKEFMNRGKDVISPEEKVQVGAFSDRKNADNLAAELKKKGYSTYIVHE